MADYRSQILDAIHQPERILQGHDGELLAVVEIEPQKWLIVVYREFDTDGFIITAFFTRRKSSIERKTILWSL